MTPSTPQTQLKKARARHPQGHSTTKGATPRLEAAKNVKRGGEKEKRRKRGEEGEEKTEKRTNKKKEQKKETRSDRFPLAPFPSAPVPHQLSPAPPPATVSRHTPPSPAPTSMPPSPSIPAPSLSLLTPSPPMPPCLPPVTSSPSSIDLSPPTFNHDALPPPTATLVTSAPPSSPPSHPPPPSPFSTTATSPPPSESSPSPPPWTSALSRDLQYLQSPLPQLLPRNPPSFIVGFVSIVLRSSLSRVVTEVVTLSLLACACASGFPPPPTLERLLKRVFKVGDIARHTRPEICDKIAAIPAPHALLHLLAV